MIKPAIFRRWTKCSRETVSSEQQSNYRRKNFNFLRGSFSKKDNVIVPIQLRKNKIFKNWFFFNKRYTHFYKNSIISIDSNITDITSSRLSMYSRESVRSRMEPRGTPVWIEFCKDLPSRTTPSRLLPRKGKIRSNTLPEIR